MPRPNLICESQIWTGQQNSTDESHDDLAAGRCVKLMDLALRLGKGT